MLSAAASLNDIEIGCTESELPWPTHLRSPDMYELARIASKVSSASSTKLPVVSETMVRSRYRDGSAGPIEFNSGPCRLFLLSPGSRERQWKDEDPRIQADLAVGYIHKEEGSCHASLRKMSKIRRRKASKRREEAQKPQA